MEKLERVNSNRYIEIVLPEMPDGRGYERTTQNRYLKAGLVRQSTTSRLLGVPLQFNRGRRERSPKSAPSLAPPTLCASLEPLKIKYKMRKKK